MRSPFYSYARMELGITPEDRALIQSLVLAISEFMFSQASRATVSDFRERS